MLETSTICTGDHQVQSVGFHFDATAKSQLEKQHVTEEMRNTMCGTKLGSTVLYLSYARCCTDIARGARDAVLISHMVLEMLYWYNVWY